MRNRILVLILLFGYFAGCVSDDVEPQPSFIDGRYLEFNDDGEFEVNGSLYYSATTTKSTEFKDVSVCMFDEQGDVLASETIDALRPNTSRYNISLTTSDQPRYIIADHPRFGEYRFGVMVIQLEGTNWTQIEPRQIDEFTYRRPVEPGQCGTAS